MYKHFFKRLLDLFVSIIGLIICALPMVLVAIAIKIESKGPVIFKQERVGKNGKVYWMYKFRSMCVGAEKQEGGVYSGKGDKRVTRVGKILRAASLDELPQFFNLLKGDMSLVGPRPPLTYHPWTLDKYTEEQKTFIRKYGERLLDSWERMNDSQKQEYQKIEKSRFF